MTQRKGRELEMDVKENSQYNIFIVQLFFINLNSYIQMFALSGLHCFWNTVGLGVLFSLIL